MKLFQLIISLIKFNETGDSIFDEHNINRERGETHLVLFISII